VRSHSEKQLQQNSDEASTRQIFEWCREDEKCCASYFMKDCNDEAKRHSDYSDYETFRYLVSHWHSPNDPLTSLLDLGGYCGHRQEKGSLRSRRVGNLSAMSPEEQYSGGDGGDGGGEVVEPLERVLKYAWMVEMRLQSYESSIVHCGENEHFVYSPSESEGRCVCNSASSDECHRIRKHREKDPWNYSMTAIIVASSAAFVYFVICIITLIRQLSVYTVLMEQGRKSVGGRDGEQAESSTTLDENENKRRRDRFLTMLHQKKSNAIAFNR